MERSLLELVSCSVASPVRALPYFVGLAERIVALLLSCDIDQFAKGL